ncbi:ATP-dependent DNA helicase [Kinneretia asaccharophila]|uniref:DNA 5'-3' helicase n=1 Tax=Roseateles asaccharophilus TaxID=582607 RepID=A0A4R6ND21_9BURK|nr:ATP-dependent DNA helicase [Roseateles asaccharophilus]MDN3543909.1 ATP-dependent DNA helicase [Roseateles asaccharophilus]TDP11713.1 ATP-dependent DNA helicase DinG [Roseateles asaccharophilus]
MASEGDPGQPLPAELEQWVLAAFEVGGPLSRADAHYAPREPQLNMSRAVARAIAERETLVVEAGTGVGKTFAYLVPALLSGGRALISTATKSLQDQLFLRDLPRLINALQMPLRSALLKGRGSYLCLHRMKYARHSAELPDRRSVFLLARVEQWAQATVSGDLSEMDGLDERSPLIPLISSTRDNCLGTECPDYRACHVVKARREALEADVVVVNHHLFFADLSLRDSGVAELLPTVDLAVFDEAHQLPEAGLQFLGTMLGTGQLIDFSRDLLAQGLAQARGLQDWQAVAAAVERAARELRLACAGGMKELRGLIKLRWQERAEQPGFSAALDQVAGAVRLAEAALATVAPTAPDFVRLHERAGQLRDLAAHFASSAEPGAVRWIDLGTHQARLVESPLDIRKAMQEQLNGPPKAWIFTSATLGDDERLRWFTEPAGLDDAKVLRVGSPFDYANHARLYVPRGFPKPSDPSHGPSVAIMAARCARALGGRTFVLTTTLRALQTIGEALRSEFELDAEPIQVLIQGAAPKRLLLQQFLEEPRSVLVGSASFWEGIDVPGDALQCVLIDKLPFPPPNDPLVEARVQKLESEGRNAFAEFFIAEAAIALKQGGGRLIRSEADRGLLVVCDPRMAGMNYGRRLRAALPPMTQVANEGEALDWLRRLAAEREGGDDWAEGDPPF